MMSNRRSLYEDSIEDQFKAAKVRVKYEGIKLHYRTKVPGGRCLDCSSKNVGSAHTYTPDWVSEDEKLIVESKGKFTSKDRTKMLAVIQSNPDKDIRMLFMRDNWLTRKKLEKYSEWAERHGIKYAIGAMPKAWIAEFKAHQLKRIGAKRRTAGERGIGG
jgi:hypothetical protein